jgi:MICOS complex subunit MIC60
LNLVKTCSLQHRAQQLSNELQELVREAEDALSGKYKTSTPPQAPKEIHLDVTTSPDAVAPPDIVVEAKSKDVYEAPLPVGFEPPPGYTRPVPPKKTKLASEPEKTSIEIPRISPSISSLNASEPVINQLAGTIDSLASFLASNPNAATKAASVLETAKTDLTSLAERIEKVKEEEKAVLEAKLDEQTREYTVKMMELEMEAQDRLDSQQEDFRKVFDEEKVKISHAYREKLENELKTQTELINER